MWSGASPVRSTTWRREQIENPTIPTNPISLFHLCLLTLRRDNEKLKAEADEELANQMRSLEDSNLPAAELEIAESAAADTHETRLETIKAKLEEHAYSIILGKRVVVRVLCFNSYWDETRRAFPGWYEWRVEQMTNERPEWQILHKQRRASWVYEWYGGECVMLFKLSIPIRDFVFYKFDSELFGYDEGANKFYEKNDILTIDFVQGDNINIVDNWYGYHPANEETGDEEYNSEEEYDSPDDFYIESD